MLFEIDYFVNCLSYRIKLLKTLSNIYCHHFFILFMNIRMISLFHCPMKKKNDIDIRLGE